MTTITLVITINTRSLKEVLMKLNNYLKSNKIIYNLYTNKMSK